MAASFEIGSSWQSPRNSFTFDLSHTDATNDDWQSPRISFSLNLPQTDRISPEKRKREEVADVNCDTDFEFCVISNNNDGRNSIVGETLLPVADQLFVDSKILPVIHGPVEAQPITIARHLSLERSRCQSSVRPTSSPPKVSSSCSGNVSSKSPSHKPLNKWKEIMFKLSSQERKSSKVVDQDRSDNNVKQQPSSTRSLWPFSRSWSTGREMKGNGLFCSLPFSRSQSTAERKYKTETSVCTPKDIDTDVRGLVEGSKPLEAWSISDKIQSCPRCPGELKPRFEAEDGNAETKVKHTSGRSKLGSQLATGIGRSKLGSQLAAGIVGGNGRLMVRNLERSSTSAAKAPSLDSPRPGRPMAEGSFLPKANNSMGRVRVSPVLNVPIGIGYVGGRWNGGGGLFGFSPKREKKPASADPHHYSRAPTNRKKGT